MSQPRDMVYMRVSDLTPAEVNPKLHDLPSLIASLHRFGWTNPALMDERTERLAAGHGRREAVISIRESGEAMPDGVILDEDGEWMIPVMRGWASRTDAEAMAYIIADNQLTIAGDWHAQTLGQMVETIVNHDAGLQDALGFDWEAIDDLLVRYNPEAAAAAILGTPAPLEKPIAHDEPDTWAKDDGSPAPTAGDSALPTDSISVTAPRHAVCPSCGFDKVPV